MKKRIIALILVVVMSVLTLFGCGEYDYSDAKLDKFMTADKAALLQALANLKIEDEDEFSVDSEARKNELHDIILRSLLNADNADDEEYKEGIAGYADALYYCYFAKYTDDDGVEHIFTLPKTDGKTDYAILPANKTYIQFGVSENADDELLKAIENAFANYDITDKVYSLDTNIGDDDKAGSGDLKVKAGDTVILSFTYKNAEGVEKKIANLFVTIPTSEPTLDETAEGSDINSVADLKFFEKFLWSLVGKNVGKKITTSTSSSTAETFEFTLPAAAESTQADDEGETAEEKKVSYTAVTVEGVVSGEYTAVEVDHNDEDEKKLTDIFGNKVDVKGKTVTYYVLPTHIKKVDYVKLDENSTKADYIKNATAILTVFYGSASIQDLTDDSGKATGDKVGALDIFSNEDYKITYTVGEGEDAKEVTKTFKEIMEEFVTLQKAYETAKTAYDKALSAFESAKKSYESAKKDYDNAVEAVNDAQKRKQEAQEALDAFNAANPDIEGDEDKQKEKKELEEALETAEKYLKQNETSLNGDPDKKDDTGFAGKLETAKEKFQSACETLGHKNADGDCKCDVCDASYDHVDENNDCKCDRCDSDVDHIDSDDDGKCDNCGTDVVDEDDCDDDDCDHNHSTDAKETKSTTEALNEALKARDEFLEEKLFNVTKEAEDGEDEPKDIAEVIVDEFEDSVYDALEETYFEAINEKIMKAVYAAISKHITVDRSKLPKKAVKEAYDKIYEGHKYDFFNSASYADSTYNYYDQYDGDFEAYLMIKTGTDSFKSAKKALKEEARDYVEEIVKIYKAAQLFDLVYTDEEFEVDYEEKYNATTALIWEYYYGMTYMTEQDLHIAMQAQKLFDALFAVNENADGSKVVDENNLFDYKMLKYTIKTDEA